MPKRRRSSRNTKPDAEQPYTPSEPYDLQLFPDGSNEDYLRRSIIAHYIQDLINDLDQYSIGNESIDFDDRLLDILGFYSEKHTERVSNIFALISSESKHDPINFEDDGVFVEFLRSMKSRTGDDTVDLLINGILDIAIQQYHDETVKNKQ